MENNQHIKSYKSKTANCGTTIILEDGLSQAIALARNWIQKYPDNPPLPHYEIPYYEQAKWLQAMNNCVENITFGNKGFNAGVQKKVDDYLGIIDDIYPIFSLNKQGYKRSSDEGVHCSPELLAAGEEQCIFQHKSTTEKHLIKAPISGDGAYRVLINTDVAWWGQADDNCALAASIIILLQRYAPVEVWIQQGWLGYNSPKNGVTLFKLDYQTGLDMSSLAFWIASPLKDQPFSYIINRVLGRVSNGTSQVCEIEADIMLRGDWFSCFGLTDHQTKKMLHTERIDLIAKYIAVTAYKMIYGDNGKLLDIFGNEAPEIKLDDDKDKR